MEVPGYFSFFTNWDISLVHAPLSAGAGAPLTRQPRSSPEALTRAARGGFTELTFRGGRGYGAGFGVFSSFRAAGFGFLLEEMGEGGGGIF